MSRIGDNSAKSLVSSLESSLETPAEKRARLISIFVAHASMFLSGFGNSLIYIGMYPYIVSVTLKNRNATFLLISDFFQLEPNVNLIEYGVVVAADAAAQMLLSPLLGVVIDRLKSVRLVCILCSVLFAAGNVFYALIGAFPRGDIKLRVWMMFVARFIVGAGTTINASAR